VVLQTRLSRLKIAPQSRLEYSRMDPRQISSPRWWCAVESVSKRVVNRHKLGVIFEQIGNELTTVFFSLSKLATGSPNPLNSCPSPEMSHFLNSLALRLSYFLSPLASLSHLFRTFWSFFTITSTCPQTCCYTPYPFYTALTLTDSTPGARGTRRLINLTRKYFP